MRPVRAAESGWHTRTIITKSATPAPRGLYPTPLWVRASLPLSLCVLYLLLMMDFCHVSSAWVSRVALNCCPSHSCSLGSSLIKRSPHITGTRQSSVL